MHIIAKKFVGFIELLQTLFPAFILPANGMQIKFCKLLRREEKADEGASTPSSKLLRIACFAVKVRGNDTQRVILIQW